jgi:hypothetical protein
MVEVAITAIDYAIALDDGRAVPNDDSSTLSTEPYLPVATSATGAADPDPPDSSPGF